MQKAKLLEKHQSCALCPETEEVLPMTTKLYDGFGGWTITRDGDVFFTENMDAEWDDIRDLNFIEMQAKEDPNHAWQAHLFLPLREAKYERSDCGHWVLIETGQGFA